MARGHPRRAGSDAEKYISIRKFFEEVMELEKLDPQLLVPETTGKL